jgi:protein-disulfide isomerase
LDSQRHQLLLQAVQKQIDEELLDAEASRQGLTVEELIDHASESESIARMADLPAPVKRVKAHGQNARLDSYEQARVRQALIVSLRRKADIHITLPAPKLPIVPVSADDDPRLGPDDAPVTIIEFSDFQCPFCQKSVPVLQELRRIYGDKLRLVYRDFPGQNHASAVPAAEASQCAREQGKFWEYHDLLFNRQAPGKPWDFLALAAELQLDAKAFSGCFNSGQFRAEVNKDLQDGLRAGVTSTPTFFINGRPLVGFHPISEFQRLIDQALQDQTDQSS